MKIALMRRYQGLYGLIEPMKRVDGRGSAKVNEQKTKRNAPKVLSKLKIMQTDDMPEALQEEVQRTIQVLSNPASTADCISSQCYLLLSRFE